MMKERQVHCCACPQRGVTFLSLRSFLLGRYLQISMEKKFAFLLAITVVPTGLGTYKFPLTLSLEIALSFLPNKLKFCCMNFTTTYSILCEIIFVKFVGAKLNLV